MDEKRIKVLAIDDDEFMRVFLSDIFMVHGGEIISDFFLAQDLSKALEVLQSTKPDAILLDLEFPVKQGGKPDMNSGFEFLKRVKGSNEFKHTKVFVITGHADKEVKKKAEALKADGYLVKGEFMPREVVNMLSRAFQVGDFAK